MSLGPHNDAAIVKPAPVETALAHPNWNVQHNEVLNHIRQERATQVEAPKPAVQAVQAQAQQLHAPQPRPEVHPPQVAQQHPQPRIEAHPPQVAQQHRQPRPEFHPPQVVQQQPQGQFRSEIPQQLAQGHPQYHPTRQDYGSHNNQSNKYLYGALAGGALLGGGAMYYNNRDTSEYGQDYGSGLNLGRYDAYRNPNNTDYQSGPYSQYNQYNQYNSANLYNNRDQYYPDRYADYDRDYDRDLDLNNGGLDYLYGDTTYGSTRFDNGFGSRPIYETTTVDVPAYESPYGYNDYDRGRVNFGDNIGAVVPALFANLVGGFLGNLTNQNQYQRRYYNNDNFF